ncbi:transcriptional regulator ATRX isoform X3 [Rhodamnia argentea]|uniref:Transcriptional regulator ATRX isoform X3 n=1 Tax=Rhodamnia argentea TaxID=178133 RepID=A0ABM3HPF2_9MYRT|nr:transcriptional regulator ATRX isoform X3 [Rhodamnia argentea]
MEEFGATRFGILGSTVRKKRTRAARRPRPDSHSYEGHDLSPLSSAPASDDASKVSSDDNIGGDTNSRRKEFNLNQCVIRVSSGAGDSEKLQKKQGNLDGISSLDKRTGLQGIPWKDFSKGGFRFGKEDSSMGKMAGRNMPGKQGDTSEPVRKSKRVPKKRLMDGEFNDDEDDELRYLEKLKTSKMGGGCREDDDGSSKKQRKLASVSDIERLGAFKGSKDGRKKPRTDRISDDTDYDEEDETGSDGELQGRKKKRQKKESVDTLMDNNRKEMTLTTRQRALQSSKDASVATGSIEYPNGLPPAPPRKQKEKLSDVEQQLKKAEAAQRRRMQNEKAARESEAEAIRKILGQDSSRKKREDKIKKRQEELAEEKAANESIRASNCIRWVMGPSGTVVTFPNEMGLPSIFDSKSNSYPPPRETCVGPACNNPYKYRDSKTKLPLCSLQCYQAVQEKMLTGAIC